MKIGMNLLLWTAHLTKEHLPILEKIKKVGFDGIEAPIFDGTAEHYATLKKDLANLGLACSTVTVVDKTTNPISAQKETRAAALTRLKWALDMSAALGSDVLAGPIHSALGEFSGQGPTDDEKTYGAEVLRAAAEHAKTVNVKIAVEYLN